MATIKKILTVFQFRRDTTEGWTANKDIVPASGEPCYDTDLKILKIGDGVTTYGNLPTIGSMGDGDSGFVETELSAIRNALEMLQSDIDNVEDQIGETNVVEIQEDVENLDLQIKTTQEELVSITQALDAKVDSKVIEELEVDFKAYVDEQIEAVGAINLDDGEI